MTSKASYMLYFGLLLIIFIVALIIVYYQQGNKFKELTYQNPVFEPVLADPTVIRGEDGFFYAYGTEDNWGDGMGPRYIPILKSQDLVNWDYIGEAFTKKPDWKKDGGLWAPEIVFFNNKYHLYYSQSVWGDPNPAIGVAVADHPAGPFTDQGKLFDSQEIDVQNSIDPMFYVDDDGTPYLFWGSFHGIYGIQLSEDGLRTVGEKFEIAGRAFEAPYIIKRDGFYYFFGSLGSCCEGIWSTYRVGVGRAESIRGPYIDQEGNHLLHSEGTLLLAGGEHFVGPGHNTIVKDDAGTDWIVYHAIDKEQGTMPSGITRRPLLIDPLIWDQGWPKVENYMPSTTEREGPKILMKSN